jgi:predicted CoA-substrate-specific enzyme activase
MYVGLDIGSVSLNAVVLNDKFEVLEEHYIRTHGQQMETACDVLKGIFSRFERGKCRGMAVTGSGGKLLARILDIPFVNEIVAQALATGKYYPDVRTIIEIGGEDSKLIRIEHDKSMGRTRVLDFRMNTLCAAGTGSFLDQQASRLGVKIEKEFGELALKSESPPRIAGRCSVFAKTDMIHLQQEAAPVHDIVAGLCYALVRNYTSAIAKRSDFVDPICFQGGVAANQGIVRAFKDILQTDITIPERFASMGAIGALVSMVEEGREVSFKDISAIEEYIKNRTFEAETLPKLTGGDYEIQVESVQSGSDGVVDAWVGIDVGSISTNVVVIDRDRNVLARRYLMTAGRPIQAVTTGLYEVGQEVADRVRVLGACTTGSGRYLTGDFVGADIVKNEITAHATGAAAVDKRVDTIFEIGGQDSKYISLENGAIVDFTMNKVCAAGTGSFLEEQAEKLDVSIKEEFSRIALDADEPAQLGERCTVFMETSLKHMQEQGVPKDSLISGLCYSIVYNYLNRVVEDRRVGDHIFFQGGTAYNRGVKAAFEAVTGRKITVPPHHDVLGAIGCALIAQEAMPQGPSKFRGFDLRDVKYTVETFECTDCSNNCEVRRVSIEGERPFHYGSRCGKYDEESKHSAGKNLPRLFRERERMLRNTYSKDNPDKPIGKKIGIPQVGMYFELFPFYKAFFTELGYEVITSDNTNRKIINQGLDLVLAEHCFPIKVAHGHVTNVLDKDIDILFVPCVVNMPALADGMERSYNCPYVQSIPYLLKCAIDFSKYDIEVLAPVLHLEWGFKRMEEDLAREMRAHGFSRKDVKRAVKVAHDAQQQFYHAVEEKGRAILADLPEDARAMVIVSRPYNGCDSALNLNIPDKLRDLGILAVPLDFLPLSEQSDLPEDFPHMYWKYGQKILAASRIIARDDRLYPIYISNFGCGPDSFISKFFAKELKGKPYLTIEVDEHSADVGAITRCEAYLDSLRNVRRREVRKVRATKDTYDLNKENHRVLYIPHMDDHGIALAAGLRGYGVNAEALPMADNRSVELGRKYTSGKECYPCIITTGDILKKVFSEDFDPERAAFFMPDARGPCRFGQYNRFQRMVLDDLGFENVQMVALDQTADWNEDLERLGAGFRRLAWKGIVVVDMMKKMLLEKRPYETGKGSADKLYWKLMGELVPFLENREVRKVERFPHRVIEAFSGLDVDTSVRKPRIGIVGEIFVRSNEFTNNFVARKVEQYGGQATLPALEEWMNYIDYERMLDLRIHRNYKGIITEKLTQWVARRDRDLVQKPFVGHIEKFCVEPETIDVVRLGSRYIDEAIRGEAILSMGKCIEYVHEGYQGIVNLTPFQCLPGTIVNALLESFKKDFNNIPVLKMAYDGTAQAGEEMRIEAFMHQAASYEPHNGS